MADVTLRHPVTGFEKTVSTQKAVHLKENGWLDTTPYAGKPVKEQDVPDVEAGKAALDAANGSKPGKLPSTKKAAKQDEKTAEQKEAEAGHAGLQVDTGASNA